MHFCGEGEVRFFPGQGTNDKLLNSDSNTKPHDKQKKVEVTDEPAGRNDMLPFSLNRECHYEMLIKQ